MLSNTIPVLVSSPLTNTEDIAPLDVGTTIVEFVSTGVDTADIFTAVDMLSVSSVVGIIVLVVNGLLDKKVGVIVSILVTVGLLLISVSSVNIVDTIWCTLLEFNFSVVDKEFERLGEIVDENNPLVIWSVRLLRVSVMLTSGIDVDSRKSLENSRLRLEARSELEVKSTIEESNDPVNDDITISSLLGI